jgi:excisionase family DNA binding protein
MGEVANLLSVPQAAGQLGISPRRVRQLLDAGELSGHRIGTHVVVDAASVARRLAVPPQVGRPASPRLAWAAIAALSPADAPELTDRLLRHRLARLLRDAHQPDDWVRLARRRARLKRYWAHPGIVEALLAEPALSVGGARAAAAAGLRVSPGDEAVAYVAAEALGAVEKRYRLQEDAGGRVELRVVSASVRAFAPRPGVPAPLGAGVLDMAESEDARLRDLARSWLASAAGGRPGE